jgi:hypothetical protein
MHTRTLGQGLGVSAIGLGAMGMSQSYGPNPGDRDDMIGVLRYAPPSACSGSAVRARPGHTAHAPSAASSPVTVGSAGGAIAASAQESTAGSAHEYVNDKPHRPWHPPHLRSTAEAQSSPSDVEGDARRCASRRFPPLPRRLTATHQEIGHQPPAVARL